MRNARLKREDAFSQFAPLDHGFVPDSDEMLFSGRRAALGACLVEEVVKLATVKCRPTFEICPSKASGYLIVVTWPKGGEQQLDGFVTVGAAQAWIDNDAPGWIAESIYSTIEIEV